jgi:Rieske Fe-S protein
VIAQGGTVRAADVVAASHFPFVDKGAFFALMEPYMSYVLGLSVADSLSEDMFDSEQHYLRLHPGPKGAILMVGGEGHKTGQAEKTSEQYLALERWARERFQVRSIDYRWSTQDYYPADDVPYIGRMNEDLEHVFVATGFKGWGMAHSLVAARLIADLIAGRRNEWHELYTPDRAMPLRAKAQFVVQNLNVARAFVADRITPAEEEGFASVGAGQARLLEVKGQRVGAYRDESGKLYAVSPVCTHMGCIVSWNDAESTWDCPCHGSRFRPDGTVLSGPAHKPLERKKIVVRAPDESGAEA